jgi:hypothetical protein
MDDMTLGGQEVGVWSFAIGDYEMKCTFQESPPGTITIVVSENGREQERLQFEDEPGDFDAWQKRWALAMQLQEKYAPQYLSAARPIYQRLHPR